MVLLLLLAGTCAYAQPAGWNINPAVFQYNMTITAKMRVDGSVTNVASNHIGIFSQGQLRGVASPVIAGGQAFYFMSSFANINKGDTLYFLGYVQSQDKIFICTDTLVFKHQTAQGSVGNPVMLDFTLSPKPVIYTPSDFDYSTLSGCTTIVDIESSDNVNEEGSGLTYAIIGGADQNKFSIDASTGVLSWSNFTPDANAPADANTDNIYEVRVKVTDSNGLTGTQTMRISVSTQSVMTSSLNCPQNQSVMTGRDVTGNCTAVIDWTEAETSSLCAQSLLTYAFTGATAGTGSGLIPTAQEFEKGTTTVTYTLPGQTPTTCSFTVTVTDDEAPTVTCPGASSNGLSGGSCSMAVSGLNATYSDNCTGSTLAYALSGATTGSGSGQATGATFQAGVTTVTYTVTDAVGNTSTCSGTVTVTVLQATVGTTDNSGAQMNDGVVCTGLKATLTSVSTGTAYAWSNGATTQSITVTPAGAETYTVTVTLGAGCTTTGQASVNLHSTATMNAVPDYGPLCHNDNLSVTFGSSLSGVTYAWRNNNPNVGTLAGNGGSINMQVKNTTAVSQTGQFVVTPTYQGCTGRKDTFLVRVNCSTMSGGVLWHETGAAVSGVTMTMTGDASDTRTTGSNGRYGFNQKNGGTFTIRPTRNQSFASTADLNAFGVNAADLAAIQAHLNGSASLTGMRLISADINVTNSVNSTDVSILSAALGGNASARSFFNTNTWRFCDSVHVFLNPSSPWGWPQAKTYNNVNGVFNRTSFRATKKGDVSQSNSRPDSDPVSLMIPGGVPEYDRETEVVLTLSGLRDMRALQAALQFDPEILELTGISTEKSAVGLTEEGVGLYDSRAGVIRLVWAAAEPVSVPDGSELVRLRFRALKSTSTPVSDLLTLIEESDLTPAAYDADYAEVALQVVESEGNNHLVERNNTASALQVLSAAPNPFSGYTAVRFMMPEPGVFTVNLYSADGRLVWSHSRPQLAGYGEVEITDREAVLPGVYYLEMAGAGMRERVRLVRM